MILIGQYDSPFVRRVAIALRLYGIGYEHRPWSTFGDADRIAAFNPLRRVPTLVLDDGESLIESGAILDHLDERVGPDRAMIAVRGECAPSCPEGLWPGHGTGGQSSQSRLRAGVASGGVRAMDRSLPGADF